MSPPATDRAESRAVNGRTPGQRGQATRQALLEATRDLLEDFGYRDLRVVDIARRAGTSAATFYQYFEDVPGAILQLATDLARDAGTGLVAVVAGADWRHDAVGAARQLVDAAMAVWERDRALLLAVSLAAGEGDARFRQVRYDLTEASVRALRGVVAEGAGSDPISALATARALFAMLDSIGAQAGDLGAPNLELRGAAAAAIGAAVGADAVAAG